MFNTGETETTVTATLDQLGLKGTYKIRDLWAKADLFETDAVVYGRVPYHGAMMLKLSKVSKDI